ncbi:hypothetical protein JOD54_006281 [Actinokineospora baliensis]|uniref:hypothetical protein n=1 Tax=Actinokineospora baliensis TaxID=547056 RepID=UPI001959A4B7|nr:hypothetical protein [Actinokineospora baliensis]MBM7776077.1 hypothetical protein [Actinokineospora baliensis]
MADLRIELVQQDLPAPGEIVRIDCGGYVLFVQNTDPATAGPSAPDEVVRYVAVTITAPTSELRHATAVHQRGVKSRRENWTLCDKSKKRRVKDRLDAQPLETVSCVQCRRALVDKGALAAG